MTVRDVVIMGTTMEEMTQRELAEAAGDRQSHVSKALSTHDGMHMRVDTLLRYLEAMGAQLVVAFPDHDEELLLDGESEGMDYEQNVREKNEW